MNLLSTILDRLNQRIEAGNIFDQIYGLSELVGEGNDRAWAHYIGNGQAIPVTNFDAKQGTLFWAKRGKITVAKNESLRLAGCKSIYETRFSMTAYAMVRKSHLPCDSADAQDWIASRVLRLISGTDPQFKTAIGVVAYEVVPSGYVNEIRYLPVNYEWAAVAIDVDVNVSTTSEDGCYDTCATGDIPLPDFEPCTPCLTEVAVDGVTITGNGTEADPLVAIGGGGGTPLTVKEEGTNVSTNTTTLNFTGAGVTASLTSPGVVEVNVPGGGGGGGELLALPFTTDHISATGNGYVIGDVVWYSGNVYRCIANNDSLLPTNTSYWVNLGAGYPLVQQPSDWSATNGNNQILNKPIIPVLPATIVEDVTATAPLSSSGGATPDISITQADGTTDGYLSSSDWNTFDGKQDALTAGTGIDLTGNVVTNTAPDQVVSLTAGTGISTSGTYPNFTIDNTAPDQIVSLTAGTDISISGTYPSFTIASTAATGMQGGQATGTDTYAVSIPGVTGYSLNDAYAIGFTNANTGASTLNINGLGAKNISKNNVVPIIGGDIAANQQFIAIYDGTNFQLLGIAPNQMFAYVTNADSVTINRGQPVYAFGATGDRMTVKLANNTAEATSSKTIGLVFSTSIGPNQKGYIITQGVIDGINTNAYSPGDTLYVGNTAGALTNTMPLAPNHLTRIGIVERANAGNGQIYVFVQNGFQLDELSDVDITTTPLANNQFLVYTTGVNNLWKNRTLGNVLGGATSQYVRGDGSLNTFPTIPAQFNPSAGTGISISGSYPNQTFTNTAPDQTVSLTAGTGITVSGTYPSFTIASSGGSAPVIYKSTTDAGNYSGATNTVVYTQAVPANTFAAGDIIRVNYRTRKTGGGGTQTLRIYVNTTANLSGTPILVGSFANLGAPSFLVNQMLRHLVIKSSTNNTEVYFAPGVGYFIDYNLYDLTTTAVINWTINQNFVFAIQNSNAVDVNFGSMYLIEKL